MGGTTKALQIETVGTLYFPVLLRILLAVCHEILHAEFRQLSKLFIMKKHALKLFYFVKKG